MRSATCRRTRGSATPTSSPATGSSPRAGWTRSCASCARPRPTWAARTTTYASGRCGGTRAPTPSCTPAVGTPPSPRPRRSRTASASRTGCSAQPLKTLSGGQRRRVELARILFSGAETLLLDEPTNHLDADSIVWLRDFLKSHRGGLVVISHDTALLESTVNRVLHLDANRAEIDVYNMGWRPTSSSARPTRSAASGSGSTPRTRRRRSPTRRTRCGPRRPRRRRRSRC